MMPCLINLDMRQDLPVWAVLSCFGRRKINDDEKLTTVLDTLISIFNAINGHNVFACLL